MHFWGTRAEKYSEKGVQICKLGCHETARFGDNQKLSQGRPISAPSDLNLRTCGPCGGTRGEKDDGNGNQYAQHGGRVRANRHWDFWSVQLNHEEIVHTKNLRTALFVNLVVEMA